ncbi:MAG: helicase [Hyphomicrobium sp.]|nr:helicase [Hyphomicrobium sp.]
MTFELTEAEGEQHVLDAVILLEPPHYVDVAARLVGPLASGLPDRLAMQLVSAPEVTGAEAALFSTALDRRLESAGLTGRVPLPMPAMKTATRRITPTPKLELFLADVKIKQQFVWYHQDDRHRGTFKLPLARLSFDYGGQAVALQTAGNELEVIEQDQLIVIPRDHKAELAAAERASQFALKGLKDTPLDVPAPHAGDLFLALNPGPGRTGVHDFLARFDDPARFLAFSAQTLPRLAGEGWQIAYSDDYPYRLAEGEAVWWADIGEGSGIDWFSFELGVEFEGHRLNLIPHLTEALAHLPADLVELALSPDPKDQRGFVKSLQSLRLYHSLPNGRLLPLPGERLAPILRSLLQLIGPRGSRLVDGKVKLHRAEAGAIADFAGTVGSNIAWAASAERLIALGNDLRRGRTLKAVSPPKSFRAELRPYQSEGLAWLDFLRETGFGGVLADDMGLGKTVQALAFLAREKAQGRLNRPALILAPTSVLPNWQAEAERFAPELSLLALCRGSERKHLLAQITKHDLVLTTYPLLMRDADILLGHEFHAAILDEAQAIKNPKAAVSGMAHRINARHRFALTGTPLENNLGEVWSLFQFLSPGLLGDESSFRRNFRTPIEKHGDAAAQAFLSRRLKPFMLRRTKQEVATELPPKIEIVEHVRLDGGQRDLYETVRSLMHKKVRDEIEKKGLAKSHIIFLDALLKLRQVCCDPRLLKMPQARAVKRSAKLERLMEMIPEMVAEGRRILLFSQFTSMLALIEAELVKRGIPYVTLTGDTADRAVPVKAFQSGKVPLFLLSLKAGGTGLNLTAADTVIHFDPWWNPAVENQATDRAYRIGQDKPVFVYKLIVEEGIETAIELLKLRKAALSDALFAGTSKSGLNLTEADISALFAPLDQHQRDLAA